MKNELGNRNIFEVALQECIETQQRWPKNMVLVSIRNQLEYLVALAEGRETDRSRLGEIIIGRQAAHDIKSLDPRVADIFYQADDEARKL